MASINVSEIIATGRKQVEEKRAKEDQIDATRKLLRNLAGSGIATADESKQIAELFPMVKRTRTKGNGAKAAA